MPKNERQESAIRRRSLDVSSIREISTHQGNWGGLLFWSVFAECTLAAATEGGAGEIDSGKTVPKYRWDSITFGPDRIAER